MRLIEITKTSQKRLNKSFSETTYLVKDAKKSLLHTDIRVAIEKEEL